MFILLPLCFFTGDNIAGLRVSRQRQRHGDWIRGNYKHFGVAAKNPHGQTSEERLWSGWAFFPWRFLKVFSTVPHFLARGLKLFSLCAVEQNEETLKKQNAEKSLSIMDYYQHDVFLHLETDARRISQYTLLHKESSLDGEAGDRLSVSIWTAHYSGLISFLSLKAPLQRLVLIPINHFLSLHHLF